ncbi:helix-turn-helix domain-containing protein [Streptacidiphilus sp. PAMC 29251]
MDSRADLGALVRAWRMARDPSLVPGVVDVLRPYLTQLDMATLLGVTEGWYAGLERGADRRYSAAMIAGVVDILDLDRDRAAALYLGTGHQPPQDRPHAQPDAVMVALMHQQRCISYIADQAWDVVSYGATALLHLPWLARPGANIMEWALSARARHELVDWERDWAVPMIGQLRMAWQRWPDNRRLAEVVSSVRELPGAEVLWQSSTTAKATPYGDLRAIYLPLVSPDPVSVRIMAYSPYGDLSWRWTMLVPVDDSMQLDRVWSQGGAVAPPAPQQ